MVVLVWTLPVRRSAHSDLLNEQVGIELLAGVVLDSADGQKRRLARNTTLELAGVDQVVDQRVHHGIRRLLEILDVHAFGGGDQA